MKKKKKINNKKNFFFFFNKFLYIYDNNINSNNVKNTKSL